MSDSGVQLDAPPQNGGATLTGGANGSTNGSAAVVIPPERPSVMRAAGRYWPLVLLPLIAAVIAAYFVADQRDPVYTAEARLIIGGSDIESRSVPGFVEATQSLAQTYSRSVTAEKVVNVTAKELDRTPGDVRSHLSATGIPDSAILRVKATGPDGSGAMALADAASAALIKYVDGLGAENATSAELLKDYKRAALVENRAEVRLERLRAKVLNGAGPATRRAFDRAGVQLQTARLETKTLAELYARENEPGRTAESLTVLSSATEASSDKNSFLQKIMFIAVVGGLGVGLLLAMAFDARRRRKATTVVAA